MRKRTSVIWLTKKGDLQKIINESSSVVEILKKLNLNPYSGNHRTLSKRLSEQTFDMKKFEKNKADALKKRISKLNNKNKINNKDVFVENSKYKGNKEIKKRLIEDFGFELKCESCKITNEYNNKPISLQLDHINGVNDDNRVENLRFLCPNCHSQTKTFSGKKCKKKPSLCQCGREMYKGSKECSECYQQGSYLNNRRTKIIWPDPKEVERLVWEKPTYQIANQIGVSDNAIGKFCKKHGIQKPPRGYWSKVERLSELESES